MVILLDRSEDLRANSQNAGRSGAHSGSDKTLMRALAAREVLWVRKLCCRCVAEILPFKHHAENQKSWTVHWLRCSLAILGKQYEFLAVQLHGYVIFCGNEPEAAVEDACCVVVAMCRQSHILSVPTFRGQRCGGSKQSGIKVLLTCRWVDL